MYRYYHMYAEKKAVEPFSNNYVIFAFYLRSLDNIVWEDANGARRESPSPSESLGERLAHIAHDAGLHYVLPRSSLTPLFRSTKLGAKQTCYAYVGWKFAYHFLNRNSQEYQQVSGSRRAPASRDNGVSVLWPIPRCPFSSPSCFQLTLVVRRRRF